MSVSRQYTKLSSSFCREQPPVTAISQTGRVERWRGGLGVGLVSCRPFSVAGAQCPSPCSVSTLPLIKPDLQISRIRLSDKDSYGRPRNVAVAQVESSEAQLFVEILIGIARDCLSRLNLVLPTQPPTEPSYGMSSYNPVRFTDGTLAEVVRPSNHDTVELCDLFVRVLPA
jgi:hypothetical protein